MKLSGWIITVLCAVPLILVSFSLVLIVIGLLTGNIVLHMPIFEWLGFTLVFLVVLSLLFAGTKKGSKMIRSRPVEEKEEI